MFVGDGFHRNVGDRRTVGGGRRCVGERQAADDREVAAARRAHGVEVAGRRAMRVERIETDLATGNAAAVVHAARPRAHPVVRPGFVGDDRDADLSVADPHVAARRCRRGRHRWASRGHRRAGGGDGRARGRRVVGTTTCVEPGVIVGRVTRGPFVTGGSR